jgi:hypothetical protein
MPQWSPLLAVSGLIAACVAATPAVGAQVLAGTSDSYLAGITDSNGAIASFESQTTGSLNGNVISRDGRFAYFADENNGAILQFARNRDTGALTPLSPPSIAVPVNEMPAHLAITRDGTRLLATTHDGGILGRMRTYPIGADGTLGSASSLVSVPSSLGQPAVTPDGRHVYAANSYSGNWIYMWSLGADGSLTAMNPARVDAGDLVGNCLVMSPGGDSVYAPSGGANSGTGTQVVRWAIGAATGMLSTTDVLPSPDGHTGSCEGTISSDGRLLAIGITGMFGGASARMWPLTTTGAVGAQAPGLTFAPGSLAMGFALDPTGRFAYAGSESVMQQGVGGLHPMRVTADGASAVPNGAAGIPTTPWKGVSVAPAQPPVAALAAAAGRAATPVRLDASASTDPDTQIARYDWEFGDGTSARDAGARPEHTYERAGEYTARVTITNTAGCSTDPAGLYNGRMNSCIGGPSATATARVRITAPSSPAGSDASKPTSPPRLAGRFTVRRGLATMTGTVPAGATRISQTARSGPGAAGMGLLETARAKSATGTCKVTTVRSRKTKKVLRRTYRCTIKLSRGTWTITTIARGKAGVVARGVQTARVR